MNWIDLVIIALIVVSGLISLFRGFVREAFSLATWIVGIWLGIRHAAEVAEVLPEALSDATLRLGVGFALIFIAVLIVGGILGVLANRLVRGSGLTGTDRSLGVIFGLLRGVVLVAVLVFAASLTLMPEEGWWENSRLIPEFERLVEWMVAQLPDSWQEQIGSLLADDPADPAVDEPAGEPSAPETEPPADQR
ncbi:MULTISPECIES: CvpA family protein [unclassified Thioalkalivibrio]|uniref:CvpA family protein n=1 Tax=unclassified Thioalkalivibrio TaxID=2621013 RepID=UPI00036F101E|nr:MULTISPECIES: CvpA family protein [unclassified Thioalkalivibrio]